jgi:hypothetical protein
MLLNHNYIIFISWLGFICYAIQFIATINIIYHYITTNNIPQVLNYSILACAFLALSVYTFNNALNKTKKHTDIIVRSLYNSPARLGYSLLILNLIITIIISWSYGEPLYFQRLIGIIAYFCLLFKVDIGIFIIIAFYIFSLIFAVKANINDYIFAISKFGLILYFSTYAYIYIINHTK